MTRTFRFLLVLPAVFFWFSIPSAKAFTFAPISVSFDPTGSGASKSFLIDNASDKPIAIELSMATREIDLDGNETQNKPPELEKQFIVFPQQTIVKPHEKRTVRVSWVGDPAIKSEKAYRFIAEQLPVETEKPKKKTGGVINILMRYIASVYITPPESKPHIVIKEAGRTERGKLRILFENQGTAHAMLSHSKIKFGNVTLNTDDLQEVASQNMLAGMTRQFLLPWPKELSTTTTSMNAEFEMGN